MARKFDIASEQWQQFGLSLLFLIVAPLAILVIDLFLKQKIPDQDLYITFAIYIVGIGAASRQKFLLGVSMLLSGAYFVAYGVSAGLPEACPSSYSPYTIGGFVVRYLPAVIFTLGCGVERYRRHVVADERFWAFG
jgi:hypothetical protein